MGNDGGSIPRRNELVQEKKRAEKVDRHSQLEAMSTLCTLSNEPLREPIVGDGLGRLYNREAVLVHLLGKGAAGAGDGAAAPAAHISGLKDVVALTLARNPARSGTASDKPATAFVCPITMKEMNGSLPFEFLWTCGCVFSAQARREMPDAGACPVCAKPFGAQDVVPVNSLDAEVLASLRARMADRVAAREKKRSSKPKTKPKANGETKRKRSADGQAEPMAAASLGGKQAKTARTQG
ncbi:Replication termination factor 2 [Coemansia spiralis]|nr:Replication termination factor 2 [Coemansia spiralis]